MTTVSMRQMSADASGNYILDPSAFPHTYGYDGSNNLITDTFSDGTSTWVKTFTYTSGNMTGESNWVKQ